MYCKCFCALGKQNSILIPGWWKYCCGRLFCAWLQEVGLGIVVGGCRRLVEVGVSVVVEGCCVRGCRMLV